MVEFKPFYSQKHHMYGLKVEVSVLPIGLAINCSRHHGGNTADITIFKENMDFHIVASKKQPNEASLPDNGPLHTEYKDQWAILTDKGYQGIPEFSRGINPTKKQPNKLLTREEEATNAATSADRVIVENFFGRLYVLWGICANKYRWCRTCPKTNLHVKRNTMRSNDREHYRCQNRLNHIVVSTRSKRKGVKRNHAVDAECVLKQAIIVDSRMRQVRK
ncbi:hypothetical protein H310_03152 [Aphanomyces invadans]|uniref:DDE Tnp4 domain-containing protein n=1 Tax=Aphanomyces invadans TaxID=157072 RepID=A0A024UL98_9STRA|nr:hypothetical protein H310_03152 [Aphanomyces invadans]ETW07079.1 hypothetical protein H310_03152 [Aphanomyces invadans]|eukprot:XP_008865154.1 hypothetical protein H310_03152 [Aphanomyces invadans]